MRYILKDMNFLIYRDFFESFLNLCRHILFIIKNGAHFEL